MTDPKVTVYLTAQDAFSTQLDAFKRKMGEVAGGMTFTTSASGRWEEGLRKLAAQQASNTGAMIQSTAQSASWQSGISKASNAVTNLAGNLLGANNQVSNVAEGLLSAFGGGGVVTVAAIGITALASAFFYFEQQARQAQKAYDDYMDALRKPTPLAIVGAQLDEARAKLEDMQRSRTEQGSGALAAANVTDLEKQRKSVELLEQQYRGLFNTLGDPAKAAVEATSKALALFQENVSQTIKAGGEFLTNPAKEWNAFPGVLKDVNAEIGSLRNLIAATKDPLEKLQLEAKLKELIALRAELHRVRAGSPFNASVGGDETRQGATGAQQQEDVTRAGERGLSVAMQGVGGERGLLDYGEDMKSQLEDALRPIAGIVLQFGNDLADAISTAFATAFATGDVTKSMDSFGKGVLAAMGNLFTQLGKTYLQFGRIMAPLVKLLFNPVTSAWASTAIGIALITLGKTLGALAISQGGGGSGGGGGGGGSLSGTQSTVARQQAGRMVFVVDEKLAMNPLHPRSVEWVAKAFGEAIGMDIIIVPKSAIAQT